MAVEATAEGRSQGQPINLGFIYSESFKKTPEHSPEYWREAGRAWTDTPSEDGELILLGQRRHLALGRAIQRAISPVPEITPRSSLARRLKSISLPNPFPSGVSYLRHMWPQHHPSFHPIH